MDTYDNHELMHALQEWIYHHYRSQNTIAVSIYNRSDELACGVTFTYADLKGQITIWNNLIVEEIITTKSEEHVFYLHFAYRNQKHFEGMINEFYQAFLLRIATRPFKIVICCSAGLTSAYLAHQVQSIFDLDHADLQAASSSLDELQDTIANYDAVYLAPQIAAERSGLITKVDDPAKIEIIDPMIYATANAQALVSLIKLKKEQSIEKAK